MRQLLRMVIATLAVLVFASPATAQGAPDFKVIVHESNPVTSMTSGEVSNLFLKKVTRWSDGQPVLPVDLAAQSRIRGSFSEIIHRKSTTAVKAYWNRQIFSGRGVPPPERRNDREIIDYVASTPGAIGYVSASANVGSGCKTVRLGQLQANSGGETP